MAQAAGGAAARRRCACRRVGPRRGKGARVNTSGRSEARVCVQTGRAAVRRRCACRRVGVERAKGRTTSRNGFYPGKIIVFLFLRVIVCFIHRDLKHLEVSLPKSSSPTCQCNIIPPYDFLSTSKWTFSAALWMGPRLR